MRKRERGREKRGSIDADSGPSGFFFFPPPSIDVFSQLQPEREEEEKEERRGGCVFRCVCEERLFTYIM